MAERKCEDLIDAYMEWVSGTESPVSYHKWIAVSVIGAACGHNWMNGDLNYDMGNNLFVLLIAKQGKTRKTTAIDNGISLLNEIEEVTISPESSSKEALFKNMGESKNATHGESNYVAYAGEFSSILATSGIDMINFFIRVFDVTKTLKNQTIARGGEEIIKPHITLLAATTPTQMRTGFSGVDMRDNGLMSRMALVYEKKPAARIPRGPKKSKELKEKLIHDLRLIASERPRQHIRFEESAGERYDEWYKNALANEEDGVSNPLEDAFVSRKDLFIVKISAISAVSRNSPIIEHQDLDRAFAIVDPMQANLGEVYGLLGTDKNLHVKEAALALIQRKGKISQADLTKTFMREVNRTEWLDIINHMSDTGLIFIDNGWVRWKG